MAGYQLTNGAITKLMQGQDVPSPVFQMLGFKKIAASGGSDRYRLNISDGQHSHTFAMLATQMNHLIPQGNLTTNSIFRGDKVICNTVGDKRVLIILELTILAEGNKVPGKIGNPVQWTEGASTGAAAPTNGHSSFYGNSNGASANRQNIVPAPTGGSGSSGPSDIGPTMPICDLTPYNNKCAIRARVTSKGDIRTWSNSKGEGKLFSCDLIDDTGEIRITGFQQSVDQFYDMLEPGHVYYFKNFTVKNANRAFNKLPHDYELSMGNETQIFPYLDDTSSIPTATYNFVDICEIEKLEKDTTIDVIGICKETGDLQSFTSKAGKELKKRDLVLVDKSNAEIILTLWNKAAEDFSDESQPVIAVKQAKVGEYNGKTLSCFGSSALTINPDVREAHALRGWYDNDGRNQETKSLSNKSGGAGGGASTPWKLLREATSSDSSVDPEKGDYFMAKVAVMSVKRDNAAYQACASPNCNKKVVDMGNGLFRCEKCNKETPEFKWRLMLVVNFGDFSDNVWATVFQESAELLLGQTSEILGPLSRDSQSEEFDSVIRDAVFKLYIVKFRSKMETFNNETRLKTSVVDLHAINYKELAPKLLADTKENANF